MRLNLAKQVALVTGAGRGIGRAIALRLAAAGCRVAAVARSERELQETAEGWLGDPPAEPRIMPLPADVTRDEDAERAVRIATERLGSIGILVNCAGFAPPRASVLKTPLEDWDRTLATCLRAPMVLTRLVLPGMLAHRQGAIINIASVAGRRGRAKEAAYAAAKFGLVGFSQALFEEVRDHGILVSTIFPGLVDTDFVPPNKKVDRAKFLQPEDVAEFVGHVLTSPIRVCPTEIVIETQFDPEPG